MKFSCDKYVLQQAAASAARAAAAGTRAAVAGHQLQIALEEAVDRLVGISGHAGNEQHMRVVDGGVRTLADIPADDEIDASGFEPARDLLVVGIVKRDGLFFDGLDILNGVNGKLRGMAEMLHHFALLAGNGNFHRFILPFRSVASAAAPPLIVRSVPRFAAPYNRNFVNKKERQPFRLAIPPLR